MITIRKYNSEDQLSWDSFINNSSRNGTIFHERKFLSYHPENKFNDFSFIFETDKKIIGVLPAVIVEDSKIISHPGSSCGGLVFDTHCGLKDVLSMIDLFIVTCKDAHIVNIQIRLAEAIFAWPVSDELSYALWHRGFVLQSREISTCILLSDEYNWANWGRKRNLLYIRKAEKEGYNVNLDSDTDKAWEIVNRNLNSRYQKMPTHSKEELSKLKQLYPDSIHPWVCRNSGGEELACVICFRVNKHAIHVFYISQDYEKVETRLLQLT